MVLTGSCYCGKVNIAINDVAGGGVICQCKTCQVLHSNNSYNMQSTLDKLSVTKGTPKVYKDEGTDSGKPIDRSFCGDCGSALFSAPSSMPGAVFIKVGCLEDAAKIKIAAEIYCEASLDHNLVSKAAHGHTKFNGMMAQEIEV